MSKDRFLLVTEFLSPYGEIGEEWCLDYFEVFEKLEEAQSAAEDYTADIFVSMKARATIYQITGEIEQYPKRCVKVVSLEGRRKRN